MMLLGRAPLGGLHAVLLVQNSWALQSMRYSAAG